MMNRRIILLVFLLTLPLLSRAFDFGLVVDQGTEYGGSGYDGSFAYSLNLSPWFSFLLDEKCDIYISAGLETTYRDKWIFMPELLRTEFSFYPGNLEIKAGRMYHSTPLGFVARGLFDGARVLLYSGAGTFSVGAWYTGLLYKKRADIAMTPGEKTAYAEEVYFDYLSDTYFAPRRFVWALGWEHLSLGTEVPLQVRLSLLGQCDLTGEDEKLHSQYATAKVSLPVNMFSFDLGGCVELIQDEGDVGTAFAAELEAAVVLPTALQSRLSLLARYSTGGLAGDRRVVAFRPLTTETQGEILQTELSGITTVSLDYISRLHNTFSAGLTSSYFIRNDLKTYWGYPVSSGTVDGYFLGNEFFARLLWSPFSDIHVNLGGGMFLPSMGNADSKADVKWRVELKLVLSL